jgi:hypothetical protein
MGESISEARSAEPRKGGRISAWITAVLTVSAATVVGFWLVQSLGERDTEPLESPLMLSVARQLVASPSELYGPFGGQNPLVLIHAPLYYRMAALAAWPMARAGLHPVTAARVAGRSLSVLGLLATFVAAFHLAQLDGRSWRAGRWAVLLIAAAPMLAGQPFAVRPDMAGVALQTAGVFLVLSALQEGPRAGGRVLWAFVAFGLAACVKQHMIAAVAVSTVLLLVGWREGRVRSGTIVRGLTAFVGIVTVVYGLEWVVTGGRIWEAAFVAGGSVGRVHPGGWGHVEVALWGLIIRAAGLIALLPAVGVAMVGAWRGLGRRIVLVAGIGLIGLILAAQCLNTILHRPQLGAAIALTCSLIMVVVFPVCALIERSAMLGNRLDVALWMYTAGELALAVVLFELSAGAWLNYAIQSVVFGAILTARAVSRAVDGLPSLRILWPVAMAVLCVLVSAFDHVLDSEMEIRRDRAALKLMDEHLKLPPSAVFFIDRPGFNRVNGRLELVYDDWLYPVFESLHLAESRSGWLDRALRSRSLRAVVASSPASEIEGTGLDLNRLGFHSDISVQSYFFVWTR